MTTANEAQAAAISKKLEGITHPKEILRTLAASFPNQIIFSTSFSEEDQIITHWIFSQKLPIKVFTLDTGRLFPETYSTWNQTLEKYHATIETFYPNASEIETFVSTHGPNSFYTSIDLRKACCRIRKVEPLKRALTGHAIWITGIRAAHSPNRNDMTQLEWDAGNTITKVHPLLHWEQHEIRAVIEEENIPVNPLHQKGFVSIGCAPCTRAIREGEDFRAGRWWWEDASKKECGLHTHPKH